MPSTDRGFALRDRIEFAARLHSIDEAPEPLRGAVTRALGSDDNIRCLIFGPIQKVIGKVSPASLLAILDHEWIIAVCGEDTQLEVHRRSFAATLLAELTEVLLYGRLRLTFVEEGEARAVEIHFNTVMDWLYREALEFLLSRIGGSRQWAGNASGKSNAAFKVLPLKFRNGIHRYLPAGDNVRGFVHWPAALERRWLLFRRERLPQGVLVLTNTQLMLISEEKAWWRGKSSQNAKYGYVVTYCPLSRVANIQLGEHEAYPVVDVKMCASQFCAGFKIEVPHERKAAVKAFIKTIVSSQTLVPLSF